MKILMLGWEFPPFFAGGVGIVCYELTKSLVEFSDLDIEYVMAYGPESKKISSNLNISSANKKLPCTFSSKFSYDFPSKSFSNISSILSSKLNITKFESMLYAYDSPSEYLSRYSSILQEQIVNSGGSWKTGNSWNAVNSGNSGNAGSEFKSIKEIYGKNLIAEVYMYANRVLAHYGSNFDSDINGIICEKECDFSVIHAHDWTTVPAALLLKEKTGKPVIFHVHITELDKTGGKGGHEEVFKIEREGFEKCDKLVCVSNFVRSRLINDYGVDSSKIEVIHNGGISDLVHDSDASSEVLVHDVESELGIRDKVVLFAGRMTLQKGPEYFLKAAKKVLEYEPSTKFVMIGSGDMLSSMIELAISYGISKSVFFHGAYTREEASEFFARADVFVMPSVSEPFGIVPLEAVSKGAPVIISRQSGISEVLNNCFKIDFWDTDDMAHRILSLLMHKGLHAQMKESAFEELEDFDWKHAAESFRDLYLRLN